MGIDYGMKRVGIAVSDDGGTIAFPKKVLENSQNLFIEILEIVQQESVQGIVVGRSFDQTGNRNVVMDDIDVFVEELQKLSGITVELEDERFTSHFLKSFDFTKSIEKPISRERKVQKKDTAIDAQAAASILQRFLDKRQKRA